MPDPELVTCPECDGRPMAWAFVDGTRADGSPLHERRPMACLGCKGSGRATPERVAAYRRGREMRRDRLARGLGLGEEADRLGITPLELSSRERGRH